MTRRLVPARPRSRDDIESIALRISQSCQPDMLSNIEPFDVERFFDCYLEELTGVTSDYRVLQPGIYGFTDADTKECVMSSDLADELWQEKFYRSTMAHEIGHAVMHVKDYRLKKTLRRFVHEKDHLRAYRQEDIITYKNPEW